MATTSLATQIRGTLSLKIQEILEAAGYTDVNLRVGE